MFSWLDELLQDFRAAARSLRRYPVTAAVAILSLGAGIGAATVTLTVRDVIFRKPPPLYRDPAQLSRVQVQRADRAINPIGSPVPVELFAVWRDSVPQMAGAVGLGVSELKASERTVTAPVRAATPDLFAVLGVDPQIGRVAIAPGEVVLSSGLWFRLFDRRPSVLGETLWIDGRPHTVVGVMPARFWYSEMHSPVWLPLDVRTAGPDTRVDVVARRAPGESPDPFTAKLKEGLESYASRQPAGDRDLRMKVSGVEGTPLGHQVAIVLPYVLATSVLLTLIIACANVAILMISQWTAREREIAIRASIGASRLRIVRGLVAESVLLAAASGAFGVLATLALRGWVVSRTPADGGFFDLSVDPHVYVTIAMVTIACGLAAGIGPALYETRRLHANPLRVMASSDRVRQRWRHALVVLEITVTVALLVETSALFDGYLRTRDRHFGFAPAPLISAHVENREGVPLDRILDAVRSVPGILDAGTSTAGVFSRGGRDLNVSADATGAAPVSARPAFVDATFFSALGVPMRAGRPFDIHDVRSSRVAIVNEALARRLFADGRAAGQRIWIDTSPHDIVGVVGDYAINPLHPRQRDPRVFLPLADRGALLTAANLTIRTAADPAPLVDTVRRRLRDAAGTGSRVGFVWTMDSYLDVASQEILVGSAPLLPLIAIGILLTVSGVYGVLAFAITRRSRELAVRMAIGARPRDLVRLVSGHSARLIAAGTAAGIGATYTLSRVVRSGGGAGSLFDPQPMAFVLPIVAITLIGAMATWFPSRRAARIDPAVLLRAE